MATKVTDFLKNNPGYVGTANTENRSIAAPVSTEKKTSGRGGFLSSLISEGSATGGGTIGAAVGSALGPLGTLAGGAIGAGLGGFLGRLGENKVRDDEFRVGDAAKEGAISAVFGASPIKALKGATAAGKAALKGGGSAVVKKAAEEAVSAPGLLSKAFGKVSGKVASAGEDITNKATSSFLKLTPTQTERIIASGYEPSDLGKLAARYGKDASEALPKLSSTIKALESGIDKTAANAGKNVRISGDDIIKGLKSERKVIAKELGSGSRLKQIDLVIADAQKKYAKGVTVRQAREILKEANNKFGKAILDDSSDAVVTAAQKLEGNVIRKALKDRFPSIKAALDDEAKNIQLREILTKTQAKDLTGGFKTGKIDLTRPGTMVDTVLNSKPVSRGILNRGANVADDSAQQVADAFALKPAGIASRVLASKGIEQGLTAPPVEDQSMIEPSMGSGVDTGLEPTAQDLMSPPPEEEQYDPYAPKNIRSSAQQILSQGGTYKDIQEFLATAKMLNELETAGQPEDKALNSTASGVIADTRTGLESLARLSGELANSSANNPIIGRVRGANPFDTNAQALKSKVATAKQIVGKALEGGVLRKEDEVKYSKLLPTMGDTDEVAQNKINDLVTLISGRLGEYENNIMGGSGGTDLAELGL